MNETKNSIKTKLQKERMNYALLQIEDAGFEIWDFNHNCIEFQYNNEIIKFYPYTGWHTGKSIKDGRGIQELLKQLK